MTKSMNFSRIIQEIFTEPLFQQNQMFQQSAKYINAYQNSNVSKLINE